MNERNIERDYQSAVEQYREFGVDPERALELLKSIPISLHCWQLDDLTGFENFDAVLSGGIMATGNAPGKPRSVEEYMEHLNQALDLIPGAARLALHSVYADHSSGRIERNKLLPEHFKKWVEYARERKIGLDFNPTYFSHPMAESGWTLASPDDRVREYWIEHGQRCRKIGEYFGRELGTPCITNHWIGDGFKDHTIDQLGPRVRLKESLDQIFAEQIDRKYNIDSAESKLFGLGSESYVPGSHEFYTNYAALTGNCIVCMDAGHFHPTELVSSKISSYLAFDQELMLHVSRPVRWDSDHVVMYDDETRAIMEEIVKYDAFDRVHIGTDYFDASINRVTATVLGARNTRKALLSALLLPVDELMAAECSGDLTQRLALYEEAKTMPFNAVWEMFCRRENVPNRSWYMR